MNIKDKNMYLSKLDINLRLIDILPDFLFDENKTHKFIYRAFPDREDGGVGRPLYRKENVKNSITFLVLSDKKPDWSYVPKYAICNMVEISPKFRYGDVFKFRIVANVTNKSNGQRIPIYTEEKKIQWLKDKGNICGFLINDIIINKNWDINVEKGSGNIFRCEMTQFDGFLTVKDPTSFLKCYREGIGACKAYGAGMLSVAR